MIAMKSGTLSGTIDLQGEFGGAFVFDKSLCWRQFQILSQKALVVAVFVLARKRIVLL